jgi:hypothetical protein
MDPGLAKVTLYDCPGERAPELRMFPESEVTVCVTLSLLVHVTFVPTLTVKVDGLNEKLLILTVAFDTTGGLGVTGTGAGVVFTGVAGTDAACVVVETGTVVFETGFETGVVFDCVVLAGI